MTAVQLRGLLKHIEGRFGADRALATPGPHDRALREVVVQALGDRPLASVGPCPTAGEALNLQF